VKTVLNGACVR